MASRGGGVAVGRSVGGEVGVARAAVDGIDPGVIGAVWEQATTRNRSPSKIT